MQRVFRVGPDGEKELVFEKRNKFFNAENLTQVAKDTSFTAIMAVGMTFVIITGYIDLSVGAIYALASVFAAMVLRAYGPDGPHANAPIVGALLGCATSLGVGLLCGLANGGMFVALRVHPFIITLGTMSIFRGIAFVVTSGQSVGSFPAGFLSSIRWEPIEGLRLVPMFVMLVVTALGGIYLRRLAAASIAGLSICRMTRRKIDIRCVNGVVKVRTVCVRTMSTRRRNRRRETAANCRR